MAGNGKDLKQAVADALMVEPALARAEVDLHSSDGNGGDQGMRRRLEELLVKPPAGPTLDGLAEPSVMPELVDALRATLLESLGPETSFDEAEANAIRDLGLEKLGEFRSAMRGHLSGAAELADQDLAIYVRGGEGRKSAFQRALEENLKDLIERPPVARSTPEVRTSHEEAPPDVAEEIDESPEQEIDGAEVDAELGDRPTMALPERMAVTVGPRQTPPASAAASTGVASEGEVPDALVRLEPIPLLTAALEAVGVAGDDFGFVLRYGRYAQPGRSSEFLVGGLGLADLSDRLTVWLDAQQASDCEVQVLDDGSGELMIYLLGHDQPIAAPGLDYTLD